MSEALQPGSRLGPYEIEARLGGGPIGVVYRARDARLDRPVALKVLPDELGANDAARRRFMHEAKAASALDHPNVCTVYEIGTEPGGRVYIAMAYCDGETLRARIERGPLAVNEALDIAIQVAQGLRRAHERGLVHRDLTPANVMVSRDGQVKILDFGLTELAVITGETPVDPPGIAYRSPEQLDDRPVDRRTDVWSLGVLLFEMLTGRPPFEAEGREATVAAVLRGTPLAIGSLRSGISPEIERVVRRALERRVEFRYQSVDDLLSELRALRRTAVGVEPVRSGQSRLRLASGVVLLVAVSAIVAWVTSGDRPTELRFTNPTQVTTAVGIEDHPAWSPDGQTLAFAASPTGGAYGGSWDIWLVQPGAGPPVNRTSDHAGEDRFPSWSPDGRQIAFWSDRGGGSYFVMPALGGRAVRVGSATPPGRGPVLGRDWVGATSPQWSPDGTQLASSRFTPGEGSYLEVVTIATGEVRRVDLPGRPDGRRLDLSWSADGEWVAYVDASGPTAQVTRLWVLRLSDGTARAVTDGLTNDRSPSWSRDRRRLFFVSSREGGMDLWQQALDDDAMPVGAPVRLTTGVEMRQAAFSPDGSRLAYSRGRRIANLWRVRIPDGAPATWADAEQLTFERTLVEHVDVSRDGEHLALSWDREGEPAVWTMPADGGEARRLTSDRAPHWAPAWSPDGRSIAFYSFVSGNRDLWLMPSAGGPPRQITTDPATDWYPTWSPDGRRIAFWSLRSGNADVWVMPSDGGPARRLTTYEGEDVHPVWWPDGESIVFGSDRAGEDRLWRVRVSDPPAEPDPLTRGPGRLARVAPDGRHVYFIGRTARTDDIWSLSVIDGVERPITALSGRLGAIGANGLATDGRYVYFTWQEDLGDIWLMDVSPVED